MSWELDLAMLHCRRTAGSPEAIAELREEIWPVLTERLTVLTADGLMIISIIDDTLGLFARCVRDTDDINWSAWIVATALSLASERVSATAWLDSVAAGLKGDEQQRRAVVIGVILGLDGKCQWALLKGIASYWTRAVYWNCEGTLKARLALLL